MQRKWTESKRALWRWILRRGEERCKERGDGKRGEEREGDEEINFGRENGQEISELCGDGDGRGVEARKGG